MLYDDIEKIYPSHKNDLIPEEDRDAFCKKNKILIDLVENLSLLDKEFVFFGGIALILYFKKIFRCHNDIDIFILRQDTSFWKKHFQDLGYRFFADGIFKFQVYDKNCRLATLVVYENWSIYNIELKKMVKKNEKLPTYKILNIDNKLYRVANPDHIKETKLKKINRYFYRQNKDFTDLINYFGE